MLSQPISRQTSQKGFVSYTAKPTWEATLLNTKTSLNHTQLCLFQNESNLQVYDFFCEPFRCLKQSGDYCKNTLVLIEDIVKWLLGQLCQFCHSDKILCAIKELYIKSFFQTGHM